MPPPRAGRRSALERLGDALRRRLRPDRGAPPATVPGLGSGEETAVAAAARTEPQEGASVAVPDVAADDAAEAGAPPAAPEAEPVPAADPAARIDAARERLRAKIEPPPDPDAG